MNARLCRPGMTATRHHLSRRPKTPAARRLDDDGVANLDHRLVAALQALHAPVGAPRPVLPAFPRTPAVEAEGRHPAMPGQQRHDHALEKAHGAQGPVTAVPSALPARAAAHAETLE